MRTTLSLLLLAAATAITPGIAAASESAPSAPGAFPTGGHFAIVAPDGHVIANVVVIDGTPQHLQVIGRTIEVTSKKRSDAFSPDLAHALGPQQMNEAWQAEIDRVYHVDHS